MADFWDPPVAPAVAETPAPSPYQTLYGPMWGPDGLTVPVVALTLLLGLEARGFTCYVPEPGKLMVTPPHDADGQPASLTSDERDQIKRYKAHFIELIAACKEPFPVPAYRVDHAQPDVPPTK